jgi:DENN domain-containing protein 5
MEIGKIANCFVVIGCPFDNLIPVPPHEQFFSVNDPMRLLYSPQILDQYPESPLPSGLTLFCYPGGMSLCTVRKPATFFSFVQTSDTGSRLFGYCLTFYEQLNRVQREILNALIDENTENNDVSSTAVRSLKIYLPKCLCLISEWPFHASFKKFLCYIYRLSLTPCCVPIERYIANFIDNVPAPPTGRIAVSYLIGDETVLFKRPPNNEPNAWFTPPLHHLFDTLSAENIILLFRALLSERQIALISSQYSLLTLCGEALMCLTYPLYWTHVYIPILPRTLLGNEEYGEKGKRGPGGEGAV